MSFGGGAPAPDTYAQDKYAAINREVFDMWGKKFKPLEGDLIAEMNDPALITGAVSTAKGIMNRSFDASENSQQREIGRYGIQMTPQRTEALNRSNDLKRGLSTVTAANSTRRAVDEYKTGVMEGVGQIGRGTLTESVKGFGTAANLETNHNNTNRGIAAQNQQSTWGAIGTGVGIAAMPFM